MAGLQNRLGEKESGTKATPEQDSPACLISSPGEAVEEGSQKEDWGVGGEAGWQKGAGEEGGSREEKGSLAKEARGKAVRAKIGKEGSSQDRSKAAGESKCHLEDQDCWFRNSEIPSGQGKQKEGKKQGGGCD